MPRSGFVTVQRSHTQTRTQQKSPKKNKQKRNIVLHASVAEVLTQTEDLVANAAAKEVKTARALAYQIYYCLWCWY